MRYVRVANVTRKQVLAERAELADSFWTRFWGLMGRSALPAGHGLVLKPGGQIHMFFMGMALDVIHLDKKGRVTHVLRSIKPWRIGPFFVGSGPTIELPVGAADETQPGDEVEIVVL